jgi:hypothetical protein
MKTFLAANFGLVPLIAFWALMGPATPTSPSDWASRSAPPCRHDGCGRGP